MKRESLKVEKRSVLGKKVKQLRKTGVIPANVYGKDMKSVAVQVPFKEFMDVFHQAHETGLVDLTLGSDTLPVLIHNVQYNPRTQNPVHADFFKVNLKEKITAKIPVVSIGEAKAETDKVGLLEQPIAEIEVEALPTDLPEKFEVSVESLSVVDDQILVSDIKVDPAVTVISEASQVVFKIGELVTKEMEEQAAADEAEAAAAAETTEGEETSEEKAEGAEGEQPAAEGTAASEASGESKEEPAKE